VFLLFAALLLCAGGVEGQTSSERSIVYLQLDILRDTANFGDVFIDLLEERLLQDNVQLSVLRSETSISPSLQILIDVPNNAEIGISLRSIQPEFLSASSTLFTQYPDPQFVIVLQQGADTDTDLAVQYFEAMSLYAIGRCDLATEKLQNVAEGIDQLHIPGNYPLLHLKFYIGNCLLLEDRHSEAISVFEDILGFLDDLFVDNLFYDADLTLYVSTNLAWLHLQSGQQDETFRLMNNLLDRANVDMFPSDTLTILTRRSQLYALAFRFDEAIADMDAAIELDPDNPSLYVERGQRLLLLYEWDRALADYNHALELAPNYADAHFYRGILYASAPEGIDARAEAIADFQHYLELTPNGTHAQDAQRYLTQIQSQLDSLQATLEATPAS
jgi:tetratricopeptide (TPR) repeat protein